MMCQLQVYSKAVQPYPYKYPSFFKIFSHLGYYKTFLNSYYKASGQVGPKMTSSTENSDPGSQFRLMWDPGDLPTMSFLQMAHHQPGELFCAGKEGHYPLLQGCLKAPKRHTKPDRQSTQLTPTSAQSLYMMHALHCWAQKPGFTECLTGTGYSAQDFRTLLEVPISRPYYSLLSFCNIYNNCH